MEDVVVRRPILDDAGGVASLIVARDRTGATRLYERAGMTVTRRYATYEEALA